MPSIYVGNLPYSTTEEDLRSTFQSFGEVTNVAIIHDRETGRSRGFGFVDMDDAAAAQAAIDGLQDFQMGERKLKVNEARPRQERR